jgi:hypothetical protein
MASFQTIPGANFQISQAGAAPRWSKNPMTVPGKVGLTRQTFNDLADRIEGFKQTQREFQQGMNLIVRTLAMAHKGRAQMLSYGGRDAPPWTIPVPVRRGDYLKGWRAMKIGNGAWAVFNVSREAFYIEHGINPRSAHPIPRRILKTSAIDTLRFVQRTRVASMFAADILGPLRDRRGRFRSFQSRLSPTFLAQFMGLPPNPNIVGPTGRLPR